MAQLTQRESPADSCIIITLMRQKVKPIMLVSAFSKCFYCPEEFSKHVAQCRAKWREHLICENIRKNSTEHLALNIKSVKVSGFSHQAYKVCVCVCVTQSCPTLCNPMDYSLLLCTRDSPGENAGVGCHSLLQGIFPTQGSNPGLLHFRQILYHLSYQGSPKTKVGKPQIEK